MESQTNFSQPESPHHPKHHIKVYVWVALVVVALLVAINGYLYFLRLSYIQQGAKTAQEAEQKMQELRANRFNTSDWQTYSNDKFGFEIKYPKGWGSSFVLGDCSLESVKEPICQWFFNNPESRGDIGGGVVAVFHSRSEAELWGLGKDLLDEAERTEISFGGLNGISLRTELPECKTNKIIIEERRFVWAIRSSCGSVWDKIGGDSAYEAFYRSFRLNNSADTLSWKTYRNEEYGFEVRIPNDWNPSICGQNCIMFGPANRSDYTPISIVIRFSNLDIAKKERLQSTNKFIGEEDLTIGNFQWIKLTFEYSGGTLYEYLTEDQNKTYIFKDISEVQNISNQILSTFRFVK